MSQALLILLAALLLSWPLVANRTAILFPDSVAFFVAGRKMVKIASDQLLHEAPATSASTGTALDPQPRVNTAPLVHRSPYYSLMAWLGRLASGDLAGAALLQLLWVAAAVALALPRLGITGWWPRAATVAVLAVATPLGFYSAVALPDVFSGILVLSLAMLLLGSPRRWPEQGFWAFSLVASAVFHTAFLLTGVALLAVLLAWLWRDAAALPNQELRNRALLVAALLGVAAAGHSIAKVASERSVGKSLEQPPFLLARMIGDGTAGKVLRAECARTDYATCRYLPALPMTENDMLWHGTRQTPWVRLPPAERARLRAEQGIFMRIVAERHLPEQVAISLGNALRQLATVHLLSFSPRPILPVLLQASGMSAELAEMRASRIWTNSFPLAALGGGWGFVYGAAALLSVLALAMPGRVALGLGLPVERVRQALRSPVAGAVAILLLGLLFNAGINGVLSTVVGRYQGRMSWLALLGAIVLANQLWQLRQAAQAGAEPTPAGLIPAS